MNQDKPSSSTMTLDRRRVMTQAVGNTEGVSSAAKNDALHLTSLEKRRAAAYRSAFYRALQESDVQQYSIALGLSQRCVLDADGVMSPTTNENTVYLITSGSVDVYRQGRYTSTLVAGTSFGEEYYLLDDVATAEFVCTPGLSRPVELLALPLSMLMGEAVPVETSSGRGQSDKSQPDDMLSLSSCLLYLRMYVHRLAWGLERLRLNNPASASLSLLPGLQVSGAQAEPPEQELLTLKSRAETLLVLAHEWHEHNPVDANMG